MAPTTRTARTHRPASTAYTTTAAKKAKGARSGPRETQGLAPTSLKSAGISFRQHQAKRRDDVRSLRERYALSQTLLRRLLDVSLRTVSSLESGASNPSGVSRNLAQTERICSSLAEVMDADYVGTWLELPNEMLDGFKPVEVIERGQIDLLWKVIDGLQSGTPL